MDVRARIWWWLEAELAWDRLNVWPPPGVWVKVKVWGEVRLGVKVTV